MKERNDQNKMFSQIEVNDIVRKRLLRVEQKHKEELLGIQENITNRITLDLIMFLVDILNKQHNHYLNK